MMGPVLGGRYELRDVLGFGGMAEVRDGWDTRLSRPVAVKLLHPGMSSQADIRERFKVEACASAALNHPDIVAVHDFGDHDGTPFIVMERLPGHTMGDQIAMGPMQQSRVYAALTSVLGALTAAHGAGILHRDIKPGNILLTSSGGVKVADFGIAKTPGAAHTTTGQIVGTLAYLSPERLAGAPASVADDLYAVGVVGYEALAGRKPFPQEDIAPLARAISEARPIPLAELRPDVDPRLVAVIERAMSRDPQRRFSSADAMRAALTGHAVSTGVAPMGAHQRPPTKVLPMPAAQSGLLPLPPPARRQPRSRTRKVVVASAALAAMAVAALAFALDSSGTQPKPTEAVSTSSSVAPPVTTTPTSSSVTPTPVSVEEAPDQPKPEKGNGNGRGNGNGKKPR